MWGKNINKTSNKKNMLKLTHPPKKTRVQKISPLMVIQSVTHRHEMRTCESFISKPKAIFISSFLILWFLLGTKQQDGSPNNNYFFKYERLYFRCACKYLIISVCFLHWNIIYYRWVCWIFLSTTYLRKNTVKQLCDTRKTLSLGFMIQMHFNFFHTH